MSVILRLFGAGAIALSALIMSRAYAVFIRRRVAEYRSILGFLELTRREMLSCLCTPTELAVRCSDPILSEIGFLEALRSGRGCAAAFSETRSSLHIAVEDADVLQNFFEKFGRGTMDSELAALDECIRRFSSIAIAEEEGASAAIRLAGTLITLCAIGIVILLL